MAVVDMSEIPLTRNVAPGWDGRFLHTHHLTVAKWQVAPGTKLPAHSYPNEQVTLVLSGEFEFSIGGEVVRASAGQLAVVAEGVEHFGVAITDCTLLDIFYPARRDYGAGR